MRESWYFTALLALYVATAMVYLVLPVAGRFGSVLLGTAIFGHDSILAAGILEWGFRSLRSPSLQFFDWTAGFPLTNTLAVTENLIGWQILYMPLRLLGVGIPAAYNLLMLASLIVSGVGAALLARQLGANRAGAAAAGFVFAFGPFHLNHMLHIQTMGVCWSPFAILFLDRYLATRSRRDAAGLGLSFVISALSAVYFAVFLGLVLPIYAALCWAFGRYRFNRRALGGLIVTGAISTIVLLPLIVHYMRFAADFGYHHEAKTLANFSMELAAPIRMPEWQSAWSWSRLMRGATFTSPLTYTPAFPGLVALGLAIYAIVTGRRERKSRAVIWVVVSLTVICYLLALGPILKTINVNPSRVAAWVPMPGRIWMLVPGIRWPMRIFFFAWLGGAVLCGLGFTALLRIVQPKWRLAVASGVILLIAIEYRPSSRFAGRLIAASDPMTLSDAYPYLAVERDRGGVVELPTSDAGGWRTPFSSRYIYASSGHLRRVVALHGSVMPPVIDTLLKAAAALPSAPAMGVLDAHGVSRVVIHRGLMPKDSGVAAIRALEGQGYPILFAGREGVVFATHRSVPASSPPE
jgi:hypothetical protein